VGLAARRSKALKFPDLPSRCRLGILEANFERSIYLKSNDQRTPTLCKNLEASRDKQEVKNNCQAGRMQQASSAQAVLVPAHQTSSHVQIVCGGSSIKGRRPQQEDVLLIHTDSSGRHAEK
jgi:hypothetical protein